MTCIFQYSSGDIISIHVKYNILEIIFFYHQLTPNQLKSSLLLGASANTLMKRQKILNELVVPKKLLKSEIGLKSAPTSLVSSVYESSSDDST